MSASHIIQARNDLFIGKDEACIMNRKEEFVKVPSGAAAPNKYKPKEIDRLKPRKRVTFDCSKPTF